MKKGGEEKTKIFKILPNNQIITACRIKLQEQEMTMNEKLTMIGLKLANNFLREMSYLSFSSFLQNQCMVLFWFFAESYSSTKA